ncbi:hypothetical protein [Synechococcus sp. 1G10]|uniref:hypothetical protein n=1 Tax=Synechococcus sp. 1G10 TaxID=2025605 RepID=UPI00117BEEE4|nr:hypothetical protein [Synechococcus sp. 1G10]
MGDASPRTYCGAELSPFQSVYLHGGKAREIWSIPRITVQGDHSSALVDIQNPFLSPTDQRTFHLSVYTAMEFCSEVILVHAYTTLALPLKAEEAWMKECQCHLIRPIRTYEGISVEMRARSFRFIQGTAYCHGEFHVTDAMDGLFEIELKGFFRIQRGELTS